MAVGPAQSPVALANQRIPFAAACRLAGLEVPAGVPEHGLKVHCPFEEFAHDDGGAEPAFRVFPDHGFCYAEWEWFTPVKLCAAVWGCTAEDAARQMLEMSGIASPNYREHWQSVVDWSQPPDMDGLASALRTYCAVICPQWKKRQYDMAVADRLAACLRLLALVRTEEHCRTWLAGCKKAMAQVMNEGVRDAG